MPFLRSIAGLPKTPQGAPNRGKTAVPGATLPNVTVIPPAPSGRGHLPQTRVSLMDQAVALFTEWAQYFLMWIGFGTLVGLVAKWLLPGKDPGGAFATLVIGIIG